MGIFDREEQDAENEGMTAYETPDEVRDRQELHAGGVVEETGVAVFANNETVLPRNAQPADQEELEGLDVPEDDEEERTPDGRLIVELVYVGKREQIHTRYGSYRPNEPFKLPENKALTVLGMKQPDNSAAFKRTEDL